MSLPAATPGDGHDTAGAVALAFVDRINAHDVAGLVTLMTPGHTFIDATGKAYAGRVPLRQAWEEYLAAFPDYLIDIKHVVGHGPIVVLLGWAKGTFAGDPMAPEKGKTWRIPAAWQAVIRKDLIHEWRIYADVEPMLRSMGIYRFALASPKPSQTHKTLGS